MEDMIRADDGAYCSPSMLVGVQKGSFIELEVIAGNPIKVAKKNGVAVPYLIMSYELLKVILRRTMKAKGLIEVPKARPIKPKSFV
jgi:ketopantoate reductase